MRDDHVGRLGRDRPPAAMGEVGDQAPHADRGDDQAARGAGEQQPQLRARLLRRRQHDLELDLRAERAVDGVAEVAEQAERLGILSQHERGESFDALLVGALDQPVEQLRAHATVLPVVGDDDRALRDVLTDAHEAGHADGVAGVGVECDQGLVVVMVDRAQIAELVVAELGQRSLETQIPRPVREALEPRSQKLPVRGLRAGGSRPRSRRAGGCAPAGSRRGQRRARPRPVGGTGVLGDRGDELRPSRFGEVVAHSLHDHQPRA